ncbi:MAG: tRNA epoxyqueuosine(34) reductase QueG [Pseudomonadales bacterium]|nr:tRNA epoxyqueuosine(34) reductase QueG [Pseudomonadales bacterium]
MMNLEALACQIKSWGLELGFQDIAITNVDLQAYAQHLQNWLANDHHGDMLYMARHTQKRLHPEQLQPGTCRVISARMDYLPKATLPRDILAQPDKAYIARYALGRDYHKLIRKRLAKLADRINQAIAESPTQELPAPEYRAFTDSAPVFEKALAEKAHLGWIGKNTLLITRDAGSWFFLGEIFTNIPLPISLDTANEPKMNHCGNCRACISICPTNALVGNNQLDARKCISYLTIENPAGIPKSLRPLIGNRIFGCDDCQLICPWNSYAKHTSEVDFHPRHNLDREALLVLFAWNEDDFLRNTRGSAIRRIKFWQWQRNIAVALGNANTSRALTSALSNRLAELQAEQAQNGVLIEHIQWALSQHPKQSLVQTTIIPTINTQST